MKTEHLENGSIRKTLNLQIGLVVLSIGITVGILFLVFSFRLEKNDFQNSITLQTKHLSDTFTQQLWLFDLKTTQQLCDLAVDSPGIIGLRLSDQNKTPLVESGSFLKDSATRIEEALHYKDGTLVGYIEIAFINTAWKKHGLVIILVGCCMMLFIIAASFMLISSLLKRHLVVPLDNLQKDMLSLTSGEFKRSELTGQKTEIQNIIDKFNLMASALASREKLKQKAETALEKSQQELLSIFRIAPTGIGVVKDRVFYTVNEKLCGMTGYSQEELLGKNARMLYPTDEDFDHVGTEKYRQIREKGTGTVETRFKRKDGKILHILMSSTPLNPNDLASGVTFTALDITKRKNAENAVRESEEKYRSIMDSMDDAAYICSPEYRIEYMNPSMEKMIGHDGVGQCCYETIFGTDEICPDCVFDQVKQGRILKKELFNKKNNRTYHTSNSPITHPDASVSMLTVFRDITDIKQMEGIVQQAQKMEAIGTLAGGIAHDFNNILFPIIGFSEMLLDDIPDDDQSRASIKNIHKGALRAKELVQQILTFSRQEDNEVRLMKIQPILKEALKMIRSTVPSTIDIRQDIDPGCDPVKADPTQIHQIIMNLTTNAYHSMEADGGSMDVTLKQVELKKQDLVNPEMEAGSYACLTVRDTGVGMSKALTEKIFDPFFTTKKKGKGTGMGLSVVHGIVTGMGGEIQIRTKPGKGSEFTLYFPIDKNAMNTSEIKPVEPIQGGTERILLVDDEKNIVEMEKLALERLGYHVTSHTNSIQALETYRAHPENFDLVITDFAMPKLPGDKLSVELKKITPDIPVLLCTGFSENISQEKAEKLGIKGFLLKPVVVKTLSKKIREVLDG